MPADTRTRLLVVPDRDSAEDAADAAAETGLAPPRVVREALAGEDDAEDAQWLAIVQAPAGGWTAESLTALAGIAADHDGWVETEQ